MRGTCIEALGSFGDAEALTVLCDLLADPEALVKESAAKALGILLEKLPDLQPNIAATNKLVEMMKDNGLAVDLRAVIIHVVAQMIAGGTPGASKGLDEIVRLVSVAKEDKLITAGIEGLGIVGTKDSTDPLIKTYDDFAKDTANELNNLHRREVVKALGQILRIQSVKTNADLPTVHRIAVLLIHVLDTDPIIPIKESAVFAIGYLYPKKFSAEHKEAAFALVFLLDSTDKAYDQMKLLIPKALEAITGVNFKKDVNRWKEWLATKWPVGK